MPIWNARHFNPRTPCGARPPTGREKCARTSFQSTHPLRGATAAAEASAREEQISIHAPLAGRDLGLLAFKRVFAKFQSTHPLRGATADTWELTASGINFNPRTPCGVRQIREVVYMTKLLFQSTHPLRGATVLQAGLRSMERYFNPRTPCGVRQPYAFIIFTKMVFQSTHPLRGATSATTRTFTRSTFQSTHPLRGATNGL